MLRTKTNSSDLRSATLIDLLFGLCLLYKAFLSSFPLSTTWVFLGLIGGRELALRIKQQNSDLPFTNREGGSLAKVIGTDLWKAAVGRCGECGDRPQHPAPRSAHRRLTPVASASIHG